jgi:hypothetical protein
VASSSTDAALVDQIMSVLGRIDAKTTELQNGINSKMHWLPGPVRDTVIAGWDKFVGFMKQLWDNIVEFVTNMGSPSNLWATADAWSDKVGGPVSAEVQSGDAGCLSVDDNWDGTAADAYRQTLPLQKAALEKVKATLTDGISAALSDVAKGIIAFWGGLLAALLALVVGIIGAIASTASILGMPAAPFIAAGAALVAAGAVLTGGLVLKSVAASANSTLRQKINENTAYHDGHWPPAARA